MKLVEQCNQQSCFTKVVMLLYCHYNYYLQYIHACSALVVLQDLIPEESRKVNFDEVLKYCESCNCPLLETSAKTGLNVVESFRLLVDRVSELTPHKFKDSILTIPEVTNKKDEKRRCVIS